MKTLRAYRVNFFAEGHVAPIGGFLSLEHVSFVSAEPVVVEAEDRARLAHDSRGLRCLVIAGTRYTLEAALLSGNARLLGPAPAAREPGYRRGGS